MDYFGLWDRLLGTDAFWLTFFFLMILITLKNTTQSIVTNIFYPSSAQIVLEMTLGNHGNDNGSQNQAFKQKNTGGFEQSNPAVEMSDVAGDNDARISKAINRKEGDKISFLDHSSPFPVIYFQHHQLRLLFNSLSRQKLELKNPPFWGTLCFFRMFMKFVWEKNHYIRINVKFLKFEFKFAIRYFKFNLFFSFKKLMLPTVNNIMKVIWNVIGNIVSIW